MRQHCIDILCLDFIARRVLQIKEAILMYMGGQLFIFYDCIYIRNYILTANPANIPLRYHILNKELLIACDEKTI